jgi:hypothetical protein
MATIVITHPLKEDYSHTFTCKSCKLHSAPVTLAWLNVREARGTRGTCTASVVRSTAAGMGMTGHDWALRSGPGGSLLL